MTDMHWAILWMTIGHCFNFWYLEYEYEQRRKEAENV